MRSQGVPTHTVGLLPAIDIQWIICWCWGGSHSEHQRLLEAHVILALWSMRVFVERHQLAVHGLFDHVSAGACQCEWARSLVGRERPDARAIRWGAQGAQ